MQNVNCITEEGLKLVLGNSKVGRLSIDQRKAMNVLLEYLHMDTICEDSRFAKNISSVPDDMISEYNEYIKDCIKYVLSIDPDIVWQKCTKCNNYYPYHINFFKINEHGNEEHPFFNVCRNCSCTEQRGKDLIRLDNDELRFVYDKYGDNIYKIYKNHNVLEIYKHWINERINENKYTIFPQIINNENDKLYIIKDCFDKGMFSNYKNINLQDIQKVCKFRINGKDIIKRINQELFGIILWKEKEFITNINRAKQIFRDYLIEQNIKDNDIYILDYKKLIVNANLRQFMIRYNNNLLGYIMELYDNKYPAYKFKIKGTNKYWEIKENRLRALKYFIEEDMKIEIEKIPLYITLTSLRKNRNTLYNVCKKYYNNLFEWINEIYPSRFDPINFDIHYAKDDFDSVEESEVHDILKRKFKNKLIYNPNNTDKTIKIEGKVPDWFVFTKNKCYIVEYFGLIVDRTNNSRVNDYKERTKNKINIYNSLDGYGKLYIYHDDLEDNFKGLMEKLETII
jgi:hypothetical protein